MTPDPVVVWEDLLRQLAEAVLATIPRPLRPTLEPGLFREFAHRCDRAAALSAGRDAVFQAEVHR